MTARPPVWKTNLIANDNETQEKIHIKDKNYVMANSKNTFLAVSKQLLRTALPVQANKFSTAALRKSSDVPHITSADRKYHRVNGQ